VNWMVWGRHRRQHTAIDAIVARRQPSSDARAGRRESALCFSRWSWAGQGKLPHAVNVSNHATRAAAIST
jgi:hypothetical protein